jgi:hypothetical protein
MVGTFEKVEGAIGAAIDKAKQTFGGSAATKIGGAPREANDGVRKDAGDLTGRPSDAPDRRPVEEHDMLGEDEE